MTLFDRACSHLVQECGELIQTASKLQMFGPAPEFNGVRYDNVADLHREFNDVVLRMNDLVALLVQSERAPNVLMTGEEKPMFTDRVLRCIHCGTEQLERMGVVCVTCRRPVGFSQQLQGTSP